MTDLPDMQETIEGLTEVTRHGSTFSVGGSGQSFYDLTLLRNALILLNAQQKQIAELGESMQWISVEDRLPEAQETVLVSSCLGDDGDYCVTGCYHSGNYGWIGEDGHSLFGGTHWMPLPAPPQTGDRE